VIKRGSLLQNSRKRNDDKTDQESAFERILSPALGRILGYSQEKRKNLNFMDAFEVKKSEKSDSVSSSRRNSADDAAVIKLSSPIHDHMQKDDFGLNVSTNKKHQDLTYTKIRSISYQNDSDKVNSLTEWMKIHVQNEAKRAKTHKMKTNPDVSTPLVTECSWEAHYFASDDDFLLDSKVRSYFKENALEKDDGILFSLPSSTTQYTDGVQEPYVFTYRDSSGNVYGVSARTLRFILILLLLIGFVLIRLMVPPHLVVLGFAVLLLSFCLTLLVLV
jgi:hypothetical protein